MNIKIFSGPINIAFAQKVCQHIGVPLNEVYHHSFPSGETYCQFKDNIRGDHVFLIQGVTTEPANESLMRLLVMADAARRSSAAKITAVMPMAFYTRQDRKNSNRVPISAKLVMDLLEAAGVNRMLMMDLHAPQIQGFSNKPVDVLEFAPVLTKYLYDTFSAENLKNGWVVVSPDVGAIKRAEAYSRHLRSGMALIAKTRKSDTEVAMQSFIGDVKNMACLIVDDLSESCGTLIQAAQACKDRGAIYTLCAVTHGLLTALGFERLQEARAKGIIDNFICSDTVGAVDSVQSYDHGRVLSVAPLFGTAIQNIHENKSVSQLFDI
jgi:ribose-phosphate pyrophosphokinase